MNAIKGFVVRYCQQHAHPVNAPLHLIGVPMVGLGLLRLVTHQPGGWALILVGYICQWVGHSIHGTEVGEVTLAKKVWRRFANRADD